MKTIKGPAIFLAQFQGVHAPFDTLEHLAGWAAGLGYKGIQVPADPRLIDLTLAAESRSYCDDLRALLANHGVELTEISVHLQGQLVAVHPAYDALFDAFAPLPLHGNPAARQAWAIEQMKLAAAASRNLGLSTVVTFSGALAWPYLYPWPQRPPGLVEAAFSELGRLWRPILDTFEDNGVDCAFELHPGEDLHDGITYERFLEEVGGHARATLLYDPSHFVLQALDYLAFIDIYHPRIKAFHVKDAEFNPTGRAGVYGGYQPWIDRPGRFRSPGDGQVDFSAIFSKLAQYDFPGWAVLEWECALKHPQDGAREGPRSSPRISSTSPIEPLTISLRRGWTRPRTAFCWGWTAHERRASDPPGMVGGGHGAFIGGVHRMAARLDGQFALVAGAFSSDPDRAKAAGQDLGIAADRAYADFHAMAKAESARPDGIEAVSIVTPNHLHFAPAKAFLEAGIDVICDKPVTATLDEAYRLAAIVRETGRVFVLTHNYTAYPMIREARARVRAGALGKLRLVQVEYAQDWLAEAAEHAGSKQAEWRTDPARAGAGGALGDIGTHAHNLAAFVTGQEPAQVLTDATSFGAGRALDDNAGVLMRYRDGARGMMWASQVAVGNENLLRLRLYGEHGGLEWSHENSNLLWFTPLGQTKHLITRNGAGAGADSRSVSRIPAGHPEGYLEGFATIYAEAAAAIRAVRTGQKPDGASPLPTIDDGIRAVAFVEACVRSNAAGSIWTDL